MNQRELEQALKNTPPKALLLYGDNDYIIDQTIQWYIQKFDASQELLGLYFDEWDYVKARSYLSQSSLFGGTNLLIIKHDKKLPKVELDTLISLTQKSPHNYLLFGFSGDAKDAKGMQTSFTPKVNGNWVRFFEPNSREILEILQKKANALKIDIDHYALTHLIVLLNNKVSLCVKELEKLAILDSKITSKDIDTLVYSTAPLATDKFLIELLEKRPITHMIDGLLDLGIDEYALLRSTQRFVTEIILFNAYIKLHGTPNSLEILGYRLPPQIEQQRASLAMKIKPATLLAICEHLLKSELEMKRPNTADKETLLYGALIKTQSYL